MTLGISKLCCKLCAAGVSSITETYQLSVEFRGRHGNFYLAWKPSQILFKKKCFTNFVGEQASLIYSKADTKTQSKIRTILSDLDKYRADLSPYFSPQRGNVTLNSDSPAPLSTEKETSSDEVSPDNLQSPEQPDDSDSDEEQ